MQASLPLPRLRRLAQTKTEPPATLRLWDGTVLEGGDPVVEVRSPEALAHLLRSPNQIGLARAW